MFCFLSQLLGVWFLLWNSVAVPQTRAPAFKAHWKGFTSLQSGYSGDSSTLSSVAWNAQKFQSCTQVQIISEHDKTSLLSLFPKPSVNL